MSSSLRAATRLALFLCLCLYIVPVMSVARRVRSPVRARAAMWFHRTCSRVFGIEIAVRGTMSERRPTLFVMNHASYLDIIVVGGLIPGCFVAKKEIEGWPIFGFMSSLQRSIFVDRRARYAAGQRDALSDRLLDHENVLLFPEGTSSDGSRVLQFKSALFSVAELSVDGGPLAVQPVSIAYTALDGIPLGRHLRPLVTWYGDMDLLPHAWRFLGLGRLSAVIEFHAPVTIAEFGSRKALADHCGAVVANGVAATLAGRRPSGADRSRPAVAVRCNHRTRACPACGSEPNASGRDR